MKKIGSSVSLKIKKLRKSGKSHRQIADKLNVSVGTAFKYSKDTTLTEEQHLYLKRQSYDKSFSKYNSCPKLMLKKMEWCRKGGLNTPSHFEKIHSKDKLLQIIHNYFAERGRIPTKRDLPSIDSTIRRYFGSWNKAIIRAGFEPNPVLFANRHEASDGHICDSFAEKIIDDWLYHRDIGHEKSVRYPDSKLKSDFLVGDVYIEFFGLHGSSVKYDRYMEQKLKMIKERDLKLLDLYPKDLFPKSKLDEVLGFLLR